MDGATQKDCWIDVCALTDIWPDTGVCALIQGRQVAVFRMRDGDREHLYALDNHDPFSGANVLSRGLVGNLGERRVVASPIYKQHFDLATGECLEDAQVRLRTWRVRLVDGRVQVSA
ncbi:nitrite reductase small subunit NirD [Sinimarinibacterium thermocellulolyticum]|uniref:Nitrite reductase small subunit NirD n=1 Tax=Sinimarinibacterium thermocellulolyticum TaxID=3170016 RepID=A0ABV2ACR1_9GAMM